jgi:hypothetical protein
MFQLILPIIPITHPLFPIGQHVATFCMLTVIFDTQVFVKYYIISALFFPEVIILGIWWVRTKKFE